MTATRVLLVEGNAHERDTLGRHISGVLPAPIDIVGASSFDEALALAGQPADCILIGEGVPGFDLSRVESLARSNGAVARPGTSALDSCHTRCGPRMIIAIPCTSR